MTETSPVTTQTRMGTPTELQVSTVGQVHPWQETKIIDPETGLTLPIGETGEICMRGYMVMLGYWKNEQRTRETIDDARWIHSGDLGTMDENGYVRIVGRIKDMIIRGGENIYPREIEEFLHSHPAIQNVQVIGVPDEKYGEEVRVLSMGSDGFSVELCGGTHVDRTGDIGLLLVTGEAGVASGVRRIEALTGEAALAQALQTGQRLSEVAGALKTAPGGVTEKVSALRSDYRDLEKELARLKQKLATSSGGDLTQSAVEVAGIKVLACQIEGADAGTLRDTLDQCKNKLGSAVVLLATVEDDKIRLVAGVTQDVTDRVRAGDVIKEFAGRLGGKGGGHPDMAQGGGSDIPGLPAALAEAGQAPGDRLRDAAGGEASEVAGVRPGQGALPSTCDGPYGVLQEERVAARGPVERRGQVDRDVADAQLSDQLRRLETIEPLEIDARADGLLLEAIEGRDPRVVELRPGRDHQ